MEQRSILILFLVLAGIAVIVFSYVYLSSKKAAPSVQGMTNPLRKRAWFILILTVILAVFASVTIPESPYYLYANESPAKVIHVSAMQFAFLIMLPSVLLSGFVFPRSGMPLVSRSAI